MTFRLHSPTVGGLFKLALSKGPSGTSGVASDCHELATTPRHGKSISFFDNSMPVAQGRMNKS